MQKTINAITQVYWPSAIARRLTLALLVFAVLPLAVQGQKTKVEFDKNLNFNNFRTFAFGPHDAVSRPMLVGAIAGAIEEELTARGLQKNTQHPDLYIQMYGGVDSDMAVGYSDLYSGYSAGVPPFDQSFLLWGTAGVTTTAVVHKGQLIVDLIDASQKRVAWRGIAKENLSENRKKAAKQVDTAVTKMFQKYPVPRRDR
jgi:hypothetical protein